MAITRLSSQDTVGTVLTASLTLTYPVATTTGNLLIVTAAQNATTAATTLTSSPVGTWNKVTATFRSTFALTIWWKISAGETSVTIGGSGSTTISANAFEFTGVNATQPDANVSLPASANNGTTTATTIATPAFSTTTANDLVFIAVANDSGSTTGSFASGATAIGAVANATSLYGVVSGQYLPTGTLSSFTDTFTGASGAGLAIIAMAFTPGAAAPTNTGQFFAFF